MLVSGLSVHTLAQHTSLNELAVKRCLDSLCRKEWIQSISFSSDSDDRGYHLGSIEDFEAKWFVMTLKEPAKKVGARASILKLVAAKKERRESLARTRSKLSGEAKRALAKALVSPVMSDEKASVTLFKVFIQSYGKTMGHSFPIPSSTVEQNKFMRKNFALLNRYLERCNHDLDYALDLIKFVFDDWDKIKDYLSWEGNPSVGMFGTVKLVKLFRTWKKFGIPTKSDPKGVAKRYDASLSEKDPDKGFI